MSYDFERMEKEEPWVADGIRNMFWWNQGYLTHELNGNRTKNPYNSVTHSDQHVAFAYGVWCARRYEEQVFSNTRPKEERRTLFVKVFDWFSKRSDRFITVFVVLFVALVYILTILWVYNLSE